MNTNNFAENLLEKIKIDKIVPKPRWHFLLGNYVVWIFGAFSLIVGSAAMSVIIYLLKYNDWESGLIAGGGFWVFFLVTLPYFWIVFLGLFVSVLYYNIKHTKSGYRYPAHFIVVFAVLASVILGELFFLFGLGEEIDDILGQKAPLYSQMFNPQLDFWFQPEEGRLAGLAVISEGNISIVDPSGKVWKIATTSETSGEILLLPGQPVKLIGEASPGDVFIVDFIKTPRAGRAFMQRPGNVNGQEFCKMAESCNLEQKLKNWKK